MTVSPQQAIRAMVVAAERHEEGAHYLPEKPVVTLSRDHGAGGDAIAAMLAERLDVPVYDHVILHKIAERLDAEPAAVKQLDESLGRGRDMWLYRLISGRSLQREEYLRHLVDIIYGLSRVGGIVVGRGGHVILAERPALRVRIAGSPSECAKRVAESENVSHAQALARVKEVNHNRGKFVWDHFRSRLNDPSQFDITVNTDRLTDFNALVTYLTELAGAVQKGQVL